MSDLKTAFLKATRLARKLDKAPHDDKHTHYYKIQDELIMALNDIRVLDFTKLSKSQLIWFLSQCSRHRPCEPFMLLVNLSMRASRGEPR